MPNVDKLEHALTFVEDNPDQHVQSQWFCSTGACLAGHAALLNGYERLGHSELVILKGTESAAKAWALLSHANGDEMSVRGRLVELGAEPVRDVAMRILGVSNSTAKYLFEGSNTAETLRLMVKDIANGDELASRWTVDVNENGGVVTDQHDNPILRPLEEGETTRREMF